MLNTISHTSETLSLWLASILTGQKELGSMSMDKISNRNSLRQRIPLPMAIASLVFMGYLTPAVAEVVTDINGYGYFWHVDNFPTAELARARCLSFAQSFGYNDQCTEESYSPGIISDYAIGWLFESQPPGPGVHAHFGVFYVNKCGASAFNVATGNCGFDEQKGTPPAYSCAGNPINIAIGNKFQVENDFQSASDSNLAFSRYYNSLDGVWRHNYSTFIRFAVGKLSLVRADGRETFYTVDGDTVTPDPTETGILSKSANTWTYTSDTNEQFIFDSTGRLTTHIDAVGRTQQLIYVNGTVTVTSDTGQTLSYTEDASHQPLSLTAGPLRSPTPITPIND